MKALKYGCCHWFLVVVNKTFTVYTHKVSGLLPRLLSKADLIRFYQKVIMGPTKQIITNTSTLDLEAATSRCSVKYLLWKIPENFKENLLGIFPENMGKLHERFLKNVYSSLVLEGILEYFKAAFQWRTYKLLEIVRNFPVFHLEVTFYRFSKPAVLAEQKCSLFSIKLDICEIRYILHMNLLRICLIIAKLLGKRTAQ